MGAGSAATYAYSVTTDSSGNIYVSGYTNASLGSNVKTGALEPFVAKYDSDGTLGWVKQISLPASKWAYGYEVVLNGNFLYLTGQTNGNMNGEVLTGSEDGFVAKMSVSNGVIAWVKLFGVSSVTTSFTGIDIDSSGDAVITGYTNGALNGEVFSGNSDIVTMKVSGTNGSAVWTKLIGGTAMSAYGSKVKIDSTDKINVVGVTNKSINSQTQLGSRDGVALQYSSSGTLTWAKHIGGGTYTYGYALDVDAADNVVVSGNTYSVLGAATQVGLSDTYVTKLTSSGVFK